MAHDDKPAQKSWLGNLKSHLLIAPETEQELREVLQNTVKNDVLDRDTFKMIEGVMAVSQMQVRDIMIPRSHMVVLEQDQSIELMLKIVSDSSHSRFPVIGENKDDVLGIVLVKDFLKSYLHEESIDIKAILRPAHFVPESKRLDSLLNDFKSSHNHLAVVVDEYGGIAGLVTIEDILEEIVGDIEDEFDAQADEDITQIAENHYHVHALVELEEVNEQLGTHFIDDAVDTIGGLLTRELGHIPHVGESLTMNGWEVGVLKADSRRIIQIELKKLPQATTISAET